MTRNGRVCAQSFCQPLITFNGCFLYKCSLIPELQATSTAPCVFQCLCGLFSILFFFFLKLPLREPTVVEPRMHICVLPVPEFQVEVQLDSHKHRQKGAVKRALFLDSRQPSLQRRVTVRHGKRVCNDTKIYLRVSEEEATAPSSWF